MSIKIAVLPNTKTQNRIFNASHYEQLKVMGEVICNPGDTSDPAATKNNIQNADVAITSWGCPHLDKGMLDAAPNLRAVFHAAGSVKPIVTDELWNRGIRVSSANGPLGRGVAETALGLTITSLKDMWNLSRRMESGGWSETRVNVRELYGVTIGVIGAGKAGQYYIDLLRNFDVEILIYDPFVTAEKAQEIGAIKVELDGLMARADVISIHAPSLPATNKMINAQRLQLMKDDAILINTARGSIIDEPALITELSKGRLFACIDVTDPEPPPADHPFRSLPNCVLLPHIAGSVNNGVLRLGQFAIDELRRFLAGEAMEGEVRQEQMASLA